MLDTPDVEPVTLDEVHHDERTTVFVWPAIECVYPDNVRVAQAFECGDLPIGPLFHPPALFRRISR